MAIVLEHVILLVHQVIVILRRRHRHREEDRIARHGIWRRHHSDLVAIEEDAEWLAGDRAFGYRHDGLHGASAARACATSPGVAAGLLQGSQRLLARGAVGTIAAGRRFGNFHVVDAHAFATLRVPLSPRQPFGLFCSPSYSPTPPP